MRPDGEQLQLVISSYGAEEAGGGADMLELLKDHWEAVRIRTAIKIEDRSLWTERRASGEAPPLAGPCFVREADTPIDPMVEGG